MNVMVLGCSGGGKSTTAAKLAEIFGLRAVHLDLILWKTGWVKRDSDEIDTMAKQAFEVDGWVSDGNHSNAMFEQRIERADMLVWVDMPRWRCMWNITTRVWTYKGRNRPSMTEGCPERLNWEFIVWVWNFKNNRGKAIESLFERIKNKKRLYRLTTYNELNEFLENMQRETDLQR